MRRSWDWKGERDQQTAALEDANAKIATLGGERDQQAAALEDANAKIATLGASDQQAAALEDANAKDRDARKVSAISRPPR